MSYNKPLPAINRWNKPFWEHAREHQLWLQRCNECGHWWHPQSNVCPSCLSLNYEWRQASGLGRVWSRCRFHHLYDMAFADDVPYNVVMVELDEGPMLISNIVGAAWDEITIGMRVRAVFDDVTPEVSLVRFEPVRGDEAR